MKSKLSPPLSGAVLTSRHSGCSLERGRKIPSFCILWISVVRFKPSFAAAPFGPPTTQPTDSSVFRIKVRSEVAGLVVGVANNTLAGLDRDQGGLDGSEKRKVRKSSSSADQSFQIHKLHFRFFVYSAVVDFVDVTSSEFNT